MAQLNARLLHKRGAMNPSSNCVSGVRLSGLLCLRFHLLLLRLLLPPQPVRCTFGLTQNPEPSQKQFTPSMIPRGPAPVAHCRSGASSTRRLCSNSRRRSARCQENYFLTSWDITTQIASSPTSGFLVLLILEARFREIDGTWAGSL